MNKNPDTTNLQRRRFFALAGTAVGTAAALSVLPRYVHAEELPHLSVDTDATAKALGYVEDATKVDKAKYATYKVGEDCSNCNFYQGGPTGYGPCQLYPGKSVHAKGWCSGYAKKA
ncbi:MAG TPA: high-potential iron-sulfur protein [Rudaea sp.]|nr:high-potential iron-sulfur protein [Rudaea sp.]